MQVMEQIAIRGPMDLYGQRRTMGLDLVDAVNALQYEVFRMTRDG